MFEAEEQKRVSLTFLDFYEQLLFFENSLSPRKLRYCKNGAGEESEAGNGQTPGFPVTEVPYIDRSQGYEKIILPRKNCVRLVQSSTKMLQVWRGNCDIQLLLYKSDPEKLDPKEIAQITDYVVSYACKGNERLHDEKEQNKSIVSRYVDII